MSKSLTEVAKAILMNESNDSAPDRGAKSMTPNMGTLRPGSRGAEGRFSNPGSTPPNAPMNGVQDLGPALVNNTEVSPSAKAAGAVAKDTSGSSQSRRGAVASEKPKKQAEVMEEDVELEEAKHSGKSKKHDKEEEMMDEANDDLGDENKVLLRNPNIRIFNKTTPGDGPLGRLFPKERTVSKLDSRTGEINKKTQVPGGILNSTWVDKENKMDEEFEISEELEAFIAEMIEEGYSEEEIAEAIDENFEFVSEEAKELAEEEEYQVDMSEHVEALLAGEELSEEFKEKAKTIFEAAVKQKVEEEIARLEEAYAEALEEEVAAVTESLTENVDDYLNYVVENWVAENEVAIEHGLRTELTEEFISGLRNLFVENYIDIPEDKVSVVEELGSKVDDLEAKLNEEIERNVALNKMINESKQYEILASACEGLTSTQAEKLKALSEGIEFTTDSEYTSKIKTLRESYFTGSVNNTNVLDSVDEYADGKSMINESTNGRMAAYVKTLGKKLPN